MSNRRIRKIKNRKHQILLSKKGNSKKLEYEGMEKVKEEAFAGPNPKDLPFEEKVALIKDTIMRGILVYADTNDESISRIDPLVEQIALLLIELWKES